MCLFCNQLRLVVYCLFVLCIYLPFIMNKDFPRFSMVSTNYLVAYRGFRLGGSTGTTWVFSCKLSCRERLERVLADSRPPIISRCRLQLVRLLCSHCGTRTGRKCNSVISIKDDAKKYQREEDYSAKQRVKKLTSLCLGRWPKNTQKVQKMSTMLH